MNVYTTNSIYHVRGMGDHFEVTKISQRNQRDFVVDVGEVTHGTRLVIQIGQPMQVLGGKKELTTSTVNKIEG